MTGDSLPTTTNELARLARELGRADRDWAILAEGNCSSLSTDGVVCVKASGVEMSRATTEDFVEVPLTDLLDLIDQPNAGDEQVAALFNEVAARSHGRLPSVESLLHAVCLAQPGISVAAHTHPVSVNAILCSSDAGLLTAGSLFPDQIVVLGPRPMLVPYIDPGLRLAQHVRTMLTERAGDTPRAIYLQNHGMFALGTSSSEVIQITEMASKVAQVLIGASTVGRPTYMSATDVARIDTRPDELLRRAALAN